MVGFCESLWWELRGSGVDLSYVLPALVNTELAAGLKRTRAANVIEPEGVAAEIVGALKSPRLAVFAPRSMGPITKVSGLLPRAVGNKIMTASGSDRLILDSLVRPAAPRTSSGWTRPRRPPSGPPRPDSSVLVGLGRSGRV